MKIKKELIEQRRLAELVPKDKLVKILSALYTYNHGDKGCNPLEYVNMEGNISNGGGNYSKLEEELNHVGYFILKVVFEDYGKKSKQKQREFDQRKMRNYFIPKDVKKFILMDTEYNVISLFETPETLAFLAKNGDERAKDTFYNFESRLKACGNHLDINREKILNR